MQGEEVREEAALAALVVFVVALLIGGWVFQSSMEAHTYQRLTGKHVTTWDAMWVELRVQEPVK